MIRILRTSVVEIALVFLTASGLMAQRVGPSATVDPAAVERGKALYGSNCSFCHGSQGGGSEQAPALVRNYLVGQDKNGELLGPVIKAGRTGQGMPAFPAFQPSEIADLVAFLHVRNAEGRGGGLPETALLTGNATAGEAYFNGVGRCHTCHSPAGDLKGIGARYTPVAMVVNFLTPKTDKPTTVKVVLPSGQTVSGTLRDMDEFVVSLDDSSGDYRSWTTDAVKSVEVTDPLAPHRAMLMKYTDPDIRNLLAYLVTLK
ncbi:MAG TPA: c-type cytochrome [Bryobacteraceae bacterium]|nr:c-type cytochrome [Bryobacteraceae bacterium]